MAERTIDNAYGDVAEVARRIRGSWYRDAVERAPISARHARLVLVQRSLGRAVGLSRRFYTVARFAENGLVLVMSSIRQFSEP